jgi:hypothetical protein
LPDAAGVMGYNWRSARYFASRGDLNIKRFKTMPILIFHGDVNIDPANPANINPVFLNEPVVFAADIGATNIFVGPAAAAPTSVPCIAGAAGRRSWTRPRNSPWLRSRHARSRSW